MRVAALGASAKIAGFGLVGVLLCPAENSSQARIAWQHLPEDVGLVILTRPAADAVFGHGEPVPAGERLVAVMPA